MQVALIFIYLCFGLLSGSTACGLSLLYFKKYRVLEIAFLLFGLQVFCMVEWNWAITSILRADHDDWSYLSLWAGTVLGSILAWRIIQPRKRRRSR